MNTLMNMNMNMLIFSSFITKNDDENQKQMNTFSKIVEKL